MTQQNEPTQEQRKEFWEWYGAKQVRIAIPRDLLHDPFTHLSDIYKEMWQLGDEYFEELPIDLNNLFKYAVPKAVKLLQKQSRVIAPPMEITKITAFRELITIWLGKNPIQFGFELALFWALWQVKESE